MFIISLRFGLFSKNSDCMVASERDKNSFQGFSFGLRQRERQIQNTSNFMINVFVRVRKVFIKIVLRKFGIFEATKKTDIKTASM